MTEAELIEQALRRFGDVYVCTAGTNSTTMVVELPYTFSDSYLDGWYIYVLATANSVPPEGECRRIQHWDWENQWATMYDAFSASPAGATLLISPISYEVAQRAVAQTIADSGWLDVEEWQNYEKCLPESKVTTLPNGYRLAEAFCESGGNLVWFGRVKSVAAAEKKVYLTGEFEPNAFITDAHTLNVFRASNPATEGFMSPITSNGTDYVTVNDNLPDTLAEGDWVQIRNLRTSRLVRQRRAVFLADNQVFFPEGKEGSALSLRLIRKPTDVQDLPEDWALWRTVYNIGTTELGKLPNNVAQIVQTLVQIAKAESEQIRRTWPAQRVVYSAFLP